MKSLSLMVATAAILTCTNKTFASFASTNSWSDDTSKSAFFIGAGVGSTRYLGNANSVDVVLEGGYKFNESFAIRARGKWNPITDIPRDTATGSIRDNTNTNGTNTGLFGNTQQTSYSSVSGDIGIEMTPFPNTMFLSQIVIINALQFSRESLSITSTVPTADDSSRSSKLGDIVTATDGTKVLTGACAVSTTAATGCITTLSGDITVVMQNKFALTPYLGIGINLIDNKDFQLRATIGANIRQFEVSSRTDPTATTSVKEEIAAISKTEGGVPKAVVVDDKITTAMSVTLNQKTLNEDIDSKTSTYISKFTNIEVVPSFSVTARYYFN